MLDHRDKIDACATTMQHVCIEMLKVTTKAHLLVQNLPQPLACTPGVFAAGPVQSDIPPKKQENVSLPLDPPCKQSNVCSAVHANQTCSLIGKRTQPIDGLRFLLLQRHTVAMMVIGMLVLDILHISICHMVVE